MAKILLCDDNKSVLKLLETKLKELGHDVVALARDGEECIRLYQDLRPDLLLLDLTMPNMDGREVLTEIIALDQLAKVIMVSAIVNADIQGECLKIGAKQFLSKSELSNIEIFKMKIEQVMSIQQHAS